MTTATNGHGDNWTVLSIREALNEKRISARELTTEFLSRIEKRNPGLNAFLTVSPERAYKQADRVDACHPQLVLHVSRQRLHLPG